MTDREQTIIVGALNNFRALMDLVRANKRHPVLIWDSDCDNPLPSDEEIKAVIARVNAFGGDLGLDGTEDMACDECNRFISSIDVAPCCGLCPTCCTCDPCVACGYDVAECICDDEEDGDGEEEDEGEGEG